MAFVYFGYLDKQLVSAAYIACSKSEAYYGVAVNNRDLMAKNLPLGHSILIESILEAKRRKLIKFNLGEVTLSDDYKMDAISKYKRGFSNIIETKVFFEIEL